jgi:hypothetical protein
VSLGRKSANSLELVAPAIELGVCFGCLLFTVFSFLRWLRTVLSPGVVARSRVRIDFPFCLMLRDVAGIEVAGLTCTGIGGKSSVRVGCVKERLVTQRNSAHSVRPFEDLGSQVDQKDIGGPAA